MSGNRVMHHDHSRVWVKNGKWAPHFFACVLHYRHWVWQALNSISGVLQYLTPGVAKLIIKLYCGEQVTTFVIFQVENSSQHHFLNWIGKKKLWILSSLDFVFSNRYLWWRSRIVTSWTTSIKIIHGLVLASSDNGQNIKCSFAKVL